jgi:hypothetical protein
MPCIFCSEHLASHVCGPNSWHLALRLSGAVFLANYVVCTAYVQSPTLLVNHQGVTGAESSDPGLITVAEQKANLLLP